MAKMAWDVRYGLSVATSTADTLTASTESSKNANQPITTHDVTQTSDFMSSFTSARRTLDSGLR